MTIAALLLATLAASQQPAGVLDPGFRAADIVWKVARHQGTGGRVPFIADPVLEAIAQDPAFSPQWAETLKAGKDGDIGGGVATNGWASTSVRAAADGVAILTGGGFSFAFINGTPYVGDPYGHGYLRVPVALVKGDNTVLVRSARGGFSFNLEEAPGIASLNPGDALLPDLREDKKIDLPGAVIVLNHQNAPLRNATLEIGDGSLIQKTVTKLAPLLPLGISKTPIRIKQVGATPQKDYDLPVLLKVGAKTIQRLTYRMTRRPKGDIYVQTRVSDIDASVQYHAIRPPINYDPKQSYAMQLTLHGASVEAIGQVGACYSKYDSFMVAPTNRRPYGLDWQEWGRMDALEALADFTASHPIDPDRVYLTGHSMGGHGTWYLGALYPDKWAAIGPSSGWVSFFSYGGGNAPKAGDSRIEALERSKLESDTLSLKGNYALLPIYANHGDKDDNVPVSEMRAMRKELEGLHPDVRWHEEPGAGHWYDTSDYPGADCMDNPERNAFFAQRRRPALPTEFSFRTQNPFVSDRCYWAQVLQQKTPGMISAIKVRLIPGAQRLEVETDNVRRFRLDMSSFRSAKDFAAKIDGASLTCPSSNELVFEASPSGWSLAAAFGPGLRKGPSTASPFKYAFNHKMVWVYGTHGTPEENAAVLAKARFDAAMWWYRANGQVRVLSDTEFAAAREVGVNVILYGNADMNTAFSLLAACPVQVRRGRVTLGDKEFTGDLGTYLIYPREPNGFSVGVIGATSALAIRRGFEPRYFTSGVSIPDYVVFGPETLQKGDVGVLASGYFNNDWGL